MVEWHHQLHGHEFEARLRDSEGQGSLACCMHGVTESDTTQRLNNNKKEKVASEGLCKANSLRWVIWEGGEILLVIVMCAHKY